MANNATWKQNRLPSEFPKTEYARMRKLTKVPELRDRLSDRLQIFTMLSFQTVDATVEISTSKSQRFLNSDKKKKPEIPVSIKTGQPEVIDSWNFHRGTLPCQREFCESFEPIR